MIMIVPIAFPVPAALMLIPPLLALLPAPLSRCVQFAALVVCLAAMSPVMVNSPMKVTLRTLDAALTLVIILGLNARRCSEEKSHGQDRDRHDGFPYPDCGENFRMSHVHPPRPSGKPRQF
jgi:hypothetical protein